MNTTNNIHVEPGSQVGQINAGALVYLNKAVTTFNAGGQPELATALQAFAQYVVDSHELAAENQKQILDLLQWLIQELPNKKRNPSMVKLALDSIGPLVSGTNLLAQHWDKLKHLLERMLQQ